MEEITIYGLQRPGRDIFYVGRTNNLVRRLKEHRAFFRGRIEAVVLEVVDIADWRAAEHAWIQEFRNAGLTIANKTEGGDGIETLSAAARAALDKGRGRKHTPEELRKMSAKTKGRRKNWSSEGAAKVRETQIKPGTKPWNTFMPEMTEAEKAEISVRLSRKWDDITAEERSRMATERNEQWWSRASRQQRAQRGASISAALTGSERLAAALAQRAPAISAQMKSWWASMSPEQRADFVKGRADRKARFALRKLSK